MSDIAFKSAVELAQLIKNRDRDYVRHYRHL